MGRGRLVDPRRSRRDAGKLPQSRAETAEATQPGDRMLEMGLFTRPLTHNWGRGRVQLIGDAAHAMLPNAGHAAQKQSITTGTGSVNGNSEWVWGYDPVGEWNKEPSVPSAYVA